MKNENTLKYKGYIGSCNICLESNTIHGKIEFINDLVTFEAEGVQDLKDEFIAAVDDYLETCKQLGKEPNKTLSGSFNVRVGEELHKKIFLESINKKKSINQVIIDALISHFNDRPKTVLASYYKRDFSHIFEAKHSDVLAGYLFPKQADKEGSFKFEFIGHDNDKTQNTH